MELGELLNTLVDQRFLTALSVSNRPEDKEAHAYIWDRIHEVQNIIRNHKPTILNKDGKRAEALIREVASFMDAIKMYRKTRPTRYSEEDISDACLEHVEKLINSNGKYWEEMGAKKVIADIWFAKECIEIYGEDPCKD